MSKIVIAGSRDYTRPVIEALHGLNLLHIEDFTNPEDEIRLGTPLENANVISEKLLKIRAIEKILECENGISKKRYKVKELASRIENEIDKIESVLKQLAERKAFLESKIKELRMKLESIIPFVRLGLPFEIYHGYETIKVYTGVIKGEFETALQKVTTNYELMKQQVENGIFIALFVPTEKAEEVSKVLSEYGFVEMSAPETKGEPRAIADEMGFQIGKYTEELENTKNELLKAKEEYSDFIIACEEYLSIEIQKAEAPLRFASTDNAFVIEGWIPSNEYERLKKKIDEATSGRVYVERKRISYDDEHEKEHKPTEIRKEGNRKDVDNELEKIKDVERSKEEVSVENKNLSAANNTNKSNLSKKLKDKKVEEREEPPTLLENPKRVKPFEAIIDLLSPPQYTEIDPTIFIFVTFPLFFGIMIGDAGYGLVLMIMGILMRRTKFGYLAPVLTIAGLYTTIIGIFMFGEAFGMPFYNTVTELGHEELNWSMLLGIDIPRSITINGNEYNVFGVFNKMLNVQSTLALSIIIGIIHIDIGLVIGFINERKHHGTLKAFCGKIGWIVFEVGFLLGLATLFNISILGENTCLGSLAFIFLSIGMIGYGEGGTAIVEIPGLISNILSYTRLVAVGLSKAGMAIAFNKIAFEMNILPGLESGDYGTVVAGILILIVGHAMIVLLGIIASGLHSLRLQYVEFFGKFYKGGKNGRWRNR
ncbi:MAG: V-type ATP synthase subunit I [Thermoplasmata archaeon]